MTQNPAQQQQQCQQQEQQQPPGEENSLNALREAHAKQTEDCEKQARQSGRCKTQVEQLGAALDEIGQNIADFDKQSPALRREWGEAVRDWRCLWQAVRRTLDCDRGANCAALRKCIKTFDENTGSMASELDALRADLNGPLQVDLEKLERSADRSLEAYSRLLVASIQDRTKSLRTVIEAANKYNTGEVRDAALAYAILYAAKRLVAGTETEVLGPAEGDDPASENACGGDDELKAFVIPATTRQYERALVAAYSKRLADAGKAAEARDRLSASQEKRKRLEDQILDRIRKRGEHLAKEAGACNLPQDDEGDAGRLREAQLQATP